ncbi:LytR/AlgR family response regulator transcription factor [Sphingobacterium deserti]|uniref:Response regulator receiver protein n=1 Tax=Sphingobacterium deserti TaxID=1229276 RepID=A0A0B8T5Y5_9SPHI|nr:LytTR family DNA-binding domain-containing protein [Sphingobacterium deserti]KGE16203.1 response regulator receiver protein [Sphingobacterium deserti]
MYLKDLTYSFRDSVKLSYCPLLFQGLLSFLLACYTYPVLAESLRNSGRDLGGVPLLLTSYFLITTLWVSVQKIVLSFDRKLPWPLNFTSRLTIQTLLIVALPSVLITGLLSLILFLYSGDASLVQRFAFMLQPVIFSFLLVINLIYTVWFFVDFCFFACNMGDMLSRACESAEKKLSDLSQANLPTNYLKSLDVRVGFRKEVILVESIGLFEASAEGRSCMLKDGGFTYEFDYALDTLAESLDPDLFFKASRRYLINRHIIIGYQPARHGRIRVQLKRSVKSVKEIIISRDFAKEFRNWYNTDS